MSGSRNTENEEGYIRNILKKSTTQCSFRKCLCGSGEVLNFGDVNDILVCNREKVPLRYGGYYFQGTWSCKLTVHLLYVGAPGDKGLVELERGGHGSATEAWLCGVLRPCVGTMWKLL